MNNNLYKALLHIEKKSPELFVIMSKVQIIIDETCPTAYSTPSNNGIKLVINKEWVETFDVFNMSALIEHELLHLVFNHVLAMKNISINNSRLLNIAQDLIINDIGVFLTQRDKLNDCLKQGCFLTDFNKTYKTTFQISKNTSKEIYDFLINQSTEKLSSFDMGVISDGDDGDGQTNGIGNDLSDIIDSKDLLNIAKKHSNGSSDMKEFVDKFDLIEKDRLIKTTIESFFASHKQDFIKSVKRPNRRFNSMPYGRVKAKHQTVLLALDTSGSMLTPYCIEKMKLVLSTALNNNFSLDIIYGDTEKKGEFKSVKNTFKFEEIKGGGGTCMKFVVDEKINDYDCVVLFTDGEFDHRDIETNMSKKILVLTTNLPINGVRNIKLG